MNMSNNTHKKQQQQQKLLIKSKAKKRTKFTIKTKFYNYISFLHNNSNNNLKIKCEYMGCDAVRLN